MQSSLSFPCSNSNQCDDPCEQQDERNDLASNHTDAKRISDKTVFDSDSMTKDECKQLFCRHCATSLRRCPLCHFSLVVPRSLPLFTESVESKSTFFKCPLCKSKKQRCNMIEHVCRVNIISIDYDPKNEDKEMVLVNIVVEFQKFSYTTQQQQTSPSIKLYNTSLYGSQMQNASLTKVYLVGARLVGTNLCNATLIDANLSNASLYDVKLNNATLHRVNLSNALLVRVDLSNADLRGANLSGARFRHVCLTNTDFRGANLIKCVFKD